ncbi:MAG: 4-hydroxythreonine-4-phosphate dehydrogenase PdxA [Burkholderiaceae bacterium]
MTNRLQKKTGHSIAITMGDPSGIGPEIVVKAWRALRHETPQLELRIVGDQALLLSLADPSEQAHLAACLVDTGSRGPYPLGQISPASGQASFEAVTQATQLVMQGHARALVTAPIHKTAWAMAGHDWPGHTEVLAHLANPVQPPAVRMMLSTPDLRVVLDSIHLPLSAAISQLNTTQLLETISISQTAGPWLGIPKPRIAVAALNPHASENGRFGREEARIIEPAIAKAQAAGILASGPWPADTVFMKAFGKTPDCRAFDLVVCLYHDQGLIPIKLGGIEQGVNSTLGLPFIRTSVDHGTAFDIAGRGLASPDSMIEAIRLADQFSQAKQQDQSKP